MSASELSERLRKTALHVRPDSEAAALVPDAALAVPPEPPAAASARADRKSAGVSPRRRATRGVRKPTITTQEGRPPMRRYTMNLPPDEWRSLRIAAADAGVDASVLMRELLRLLVEDQAVRRRVFAAVGRS